MHNMQKLKLMIKLCNDIIYFRKLIAIHFHVAIVIISLMFRKPLILNRLNSMFTLVLLEMENSQSQENSIIEIT